MNKEIAKKLTDVVAGSGSKLWQIDDDNWVGVAWTGDGRILIIEEDKISEYSGGEAWDKIDAFLEPLYSSNNDAGGSGSLPAVTPNKIIKWKLASSNTPTNITSTSNDLVLQSNSKIKLKSWKGDFLHRPDSQQGVTSWDTGVGNEWIVEVIDGNKIKLKSWKGDYLHRPDSNQGVTSWHTGVGNEWLVEVIDNNKIKLKSWKGDYLHRPDSNQGVTSWHTGIGNEWLVEVISAVEPVPAPEPLPKPDDPDIIITAIADVYMSNLVYKGEVKRTQSDEYVELTNRGNKAANISGWKITSAGSTKQWFIFPEGSVLDADKSFRVYTNEIHAETGGFSFASKTAIWNDAGDELNLFNAKGENVATLTYGKARKKP